MAEPSQPARPSKPRDFTPLYAIYAQAGLVPWTRIGEARRALRALCAEQDTERERYRQETIERAARETDEAESEAGE